MALYYKPGPMTEGKRNIIQGLLQEYNIESAADIQEALKDLLGGTIKEMMEAEMDEHLGYEKSERSDSDDARNGYKSKRITTSYGGMEIEVPQDRKSTFEPKVVKKRQKDISEIDQKIISMYAKGMTTRQISDTLMDIYGFEASEGFISDVTDKLLPQIEEWQKRPLSEIYPVVFIDAIHYSVRDNNVIRKLAAYVILGINCEGRKEVLSIQVGENESAKYWLSVLNELRNRGVKDILILCADGLTGMKEAITAAYPQTEYQRCIVHQVRNTLKYVSDKDRKAFANDLKMIYNAPSEQEGREALESDLFSSTYSHVKSAKKQEASLPIIRRECLVCIDYSQMPAIILLNLQSLAVPVKEHYLFSHAFGKAVDVFCDNGVIHQGNPHLSWDESVQRETTSYSFFSQAAGRERIALITAGSNLALRL